MNKIFCLGFHKTGTTSLGKALEILGYRVIGAVEKHHPDLENQVLDLVKPYLADYDAFRDNPWPFLYPQLDRLFPDSRFILTIRDSEAWLQSMVRNFGTVETPMRRWIYGSNAGAPVENEGRYRKRFEQHEREVREYFSPRPQDLLILDFGAGDGWEQLCPFLERPIPHAPFPRLNRTRRF